MACRICPKIKKYDFFWIVFVCVAMWGVNKYQEHKAEVKKQVEKQQFLDLQKKCLFGDEVACKEAYHSESKNY
ncbi:hypothetical protein CQA57_04245 [Helicobacter anseris]|uniref:Uncharacterized protein n=1 Tax=Helicobacter anseris TaxID=375926 RepID=A0A3D8J8X4_9HELI|nr:hypothetical protein [Helicobacter anseris]RDU73882.1 hypothetical protein CQA57_04245 [Helicobacter anseris]